MNAKIDISNVILKTNRLMLRPFNIDDLGDFYEYASVDGVGQMAGWLPHKNKEECLTVAACGYPHGFGSNLAVLVGTGMNRIAEKAVANWVNSPGHFETIINADCDTLGVGITIDNSRAFCYMMVGHPNAYNPYGP